ncbi:MAG: cupin domain-containing protein [Vicinamibacteria bacterium]|nr:cupin domain-containing protein [Vicinamibacteria bacterium]
MTTPGIPALVEPFLPFPILEGLLSPFELKPFLEEYWEKKWLLVEAQSPAREALLVPDWESVAAPAFALDRKMVEVLVPGRPPDLQSFEQVREAFARGASVRIFNAQKLLDPLKRLCADLSLELSHPVRANLYITPPNRQGLDPHVDDHDVLVVQMSGRKGWKIYGAPFELPLEHSFPLYFEMGTRARSRSTWAGEIWGARSFKGKDLGQPDYDGPIETGELLYVPRGLLHVASSLDQASVHATIGIHATRIADLAALALDRVARENQDLRRSLPLGFARYVGKPSGVSAPIDLALRAVTPDGIRDTIEEVGARHLVTHYEVFEPQPVPPERAPDVDVDSDIPTMDGVAPAPPAPAVEVRPLETTQFRLHPDVQISHRPDIVSLKRFRRGGGQADFPAAFADALVQIASRPRFRLEDLKVLSPRSTRTLLTHLVEKGLVEQIS